MRSNSRNRGLPLFACASLFFFPTLNALPDVARAADLGGEAPVEDNLDGYDYGEDDYVPPSPVYYTLRGAATGNEDFNGGTGASGSLAVGLDLDQMYELSLLRLEIEVDYATQPDASLGTTNTDVSSVTGFVSLYRDLAEFHRLRPYVGAGVGIGHVSYNATTGPEGDSTGVAWHVTTGLAIDWSDRATVDLGYRYMAIEGMDVSAGGATETQRLGTHGVFAGLRFRL